jgi:hypothetical protein
MIKNLILSTMRMAVDTPLKTPPPPPPRIHFSTVTSLLCSADCRTIPANCGADCLVGASVISDAEGARSQDFTSSEYVPTGTRVMPLPGALKPPQLR